MSSEDHNLEFLTSNENANKPPERNPNVQHSDNTSSRSATPVKQKSANAIERIVILLYGPKHVLMLLVPISLNMVMVVATVTFMPFYTKDVDAIYVEISGKEIEDELDTETLLWQSARMALTLLISIILITILLLFLYKYRFYRVIRGWLLIVSFILLFYFSCIYLEQVLYVHNVPFDYFTAAIIVWNFGVGGFISIHWKAPLLLQQPYLIIISSLVALTFVKSLPDLTAWTLLCVLIIWDLIAVLCPKGPLKLLIDIAKERDEPILPALIYSSTILWQITVIVSDPIEQTDSSAVPDAEVTTETLPVDAEEVNKRLMSAAELMHGMESQSENVFSTSLPDTGTTSAIDQSKSLGPLNDGLKEACCVNVTKEVAAYSGGLKKQPVVKGKTEIKNDLGSSVDPQKSIGKRKSAHRAQSAIRNKRRSLKKRKLNFEDEIEKGVKLGLGDFIFYGLLIGKTAIKGDWNATITCYLSIIIGLCCTLLLLSIIQKPLPALPISLTFGLLFTLLAHTTVQPFMESLAYKQVYI